MQCGWRMAIVGLLGVCAAGGCGASDAPTATAAVVAPATAPTTRASEGLLAERENLLRLVAAEYRKFGAVDAEARWAPGLCRSPMPAAARFSRSDDADTHGQKLYLVYAKDADAYADISGLPHSVLWISRWDPQLNAVAQIIVKESWTPKKVTAQEISDTQRQPRTQPARRDGEFFIPGEQRDLFVMMRFVDAKAPDTDDGWIYGTISPDGKRISSIGRVESCMSCHIEAPHGRLFGLPHGG